MSDRRIVLHVEGGISAEQARDARARAWGYVFRCHANKEAANRGGRDDVRKDRHAHTDIRNST
jgi:hypothetical protein